MFAFSQLLFQYLEGEVKVGKWVPILPYTGLYLRVINPHTRQLTFSKYYSTDYFMDKEFLENLQNLKNGRIAIVASFVGASVILLMYLFAVDIHGTV